MSKISVCEAISIFCKYAALGVLPHPLLLLQKQLLSHKRRRRRRRSQALLSDLPGSMYIFGQDGKRENERGFVYIRLGEMDKKFAL